MDQIPHAGEFASLLTAFFWNFSAVAWGLAGRRVGSVAVTTIRIVLATGILAVLFHHLHGAWWPSDLGSGAVHLFVWSGTVGAGLGDLLFFRSLLLIGPRLGMLILSLQPIFATFIAWTTPLGETLNLQGILGIVLTVGGVTWVVGLQGGDTSWRPPAGGRFSSGVWLGLSGTVLVAIGFVLSRMGFAASAGIAQAELGAAYIRVFAATMFSLAALPLLRQTRATFRACTDGRAMLIISLGTLVGPVIGIWMSMVAIRLAPAGVVTALMSTAPIMMIPITWISYGDRPNLRSLAGTLLAVAGALLLILR